MHLAFSIWLKIQWCGCKLSLPDLRYRRKNKEKQEPHELTQWTPGDLHLKRREKKENASAWGKGRCTTRADTREEGFREMEGGGGVEQ